MIIISPAKNLNILPEKASLKLSEPFFVNDTNSLVSKLKKLKFDNLKKLMKISDSLTELNLQRFQDFNSNDNVFKPAGFLFSGDTFLDKMFCKKFKPAIFLENFSPISLKEKKAFVSF